MKRRQRIKTGPHTHGYIETRDCAYLGEPTGETSTCGSCAGNVRIKLRACAVNGTCTTDQRVNGTACCAVCMDRVPIAPLEWHYFEEFGPLQAFNASIVRWRGQLLMAYRVSRGGSEIHLARLDDNLGIGEIQHLPLKHAQAGWGREDPRLFVHAGKLHVSYHGVLGTQGPTSVLYARLSDDLEVERIFYPAFAERRPWEKNWTFFEWSGELFAVYTVRPHVVMHVVNDRAETFSRVPWAPHWTGGEMRGGASPVLIGEEFWCWFHGSVDPPRPTPWGPAKARAYNVGVYCFEAKPPFRPTRYTPEPVTWAQPKTRPADFWCDCIFPGGAVLDGERWRVAVGEHDSWCSILEYDHAAIARLLVRA